MDLSNFMSKFNFSQKYAFHVGVERERFLTQNGTIVPYSPAVLKQIAKEPWTCNDQSVKTENVESMVGYELSACQIETRTEPLCIQDVAAQLRWQDEQLSKTLDQLGLGIDYNEVAPDNMPLDTYPDPTGRYQRISQEMPKEILLAACQVIGTHIHIGMPDHETALHVYNKVTESCADLCKLGDGSNGKRLSIYQVVAPDPMPKKFKTWNDFFQKALMDGFAEDPRKCWTLIRISKHGTIEFRMFGSSSSIDTIMHWVKTCHELCLRALD